MRPGFDLAGILRHQDRVALGGRHHLPRVGYAMKLMVPTLMCDFMVNRTTEVGAKVIRAGEIMPLPYANALLLTAIGGGAIVNAEDKHLEAQECLAVYGGDAWFQHSHQTISRVAEYLASVNADAGKSN